MCLSMTFSICPGILSKFYTILNEMIKIGVGILKKSNQQYVRANNTENISYYIYSLISLL